MVPGVSCFFGSAVSSLSDVALPFFRVFLCLRRLHAHLLADGSMQVSLAELLAGLALCLQDPLFCKLSQFYFLIFR